MELMMSCLEEDGDMIINMTMKNLYSGFNIIDFKEFTPINHWSDKNYPKLNNFYDYIMKVIISLNN